MDFLKLVEKARSCRRFVESSPLSQEDLDWLASCARLAPSGRNAQELRFILVGQGEALGKLFALTRWAGALKGWGGPKEGERPTAFIAALMPARGGDLLCFDGGIACQTMQLAAAWGRDRPREPAPAFSKPMPAEADGRADASEIQARLGENERRGLGRGAPRGH